MLFVHRLAAWVQTGVGHVHTVAMSSFGAQLDVSGTAPHHVHNGSASSRFAIAVVGRQWLPQPIGRVWESGVTLQPHSFGLCVVAVVGLWCATVLGTMVLRCCVCGNRGRRAHNGHPEDLRGLVG